MPTFKNDLSPITDQRDIGPGDAIIEVNGQRGGHHDHDDHHHDHHECDQELGRGGFGRVIRGHKVGETTMAIKYLPLSKVKNEVAPCPTSGPKST